MKTWKNAEVVELNIAETANGIPTGYAEGTEVDLNGPFPGGKYETQWGTVPNKGEGGKTPGEDEKVENPS